MRSEGQTIRGGMIVTSIDAGDEWHDCTFIRTFIIVGGTTIAGLRAAKPIFYNCVFKPELFNEPAVVLYGKGAFNERPRIIE